MKLAFWAVAGAAAMIMTFIVAMAVCRLAGVPWYWAWAAVLAVFCYSAGKSLEP